MAQSRGRLELAMTLTWGELKPRTSSFTGSSLCVWYIGLTYIFKSPKPSKDLISRWTHCDLGNYTVISPKVSGIPAGQDGEAGLGATGARLTQKLPFHISWTSGTPAGLSALPEMQNMSLFPSRKLLARQKLF